MKKRLLLCAVCALLLLAPMRAFAAELPEDLVDAAGGRGESIAESGELSDASGFTAGLTGLVRDLAPELLSSFRDAVRSAVLMLLVVLLCALGSGLFAGAAGEEKADLMPLAGVLALTGIAAAHLNGLMASASSVLSELDAFSKVLLPTLAAATASAGAAATASVQQVTTVLLSDLLITAISELLLPLVYGYVALCAAAAALPESRLDQLAEGLKKLVSWLLTAVLGAFTAYLSVTRALSSSADALSVRLTRAALAGTVPVVGSVISDTAETVLAGAGMLRNSIGVFGMLGVFSICLLPFFSLLARYLLLQLAAAAAEAADGGRLSRFLQQLGGAFGLLLGMAGSCALLLLISVFSSISVVVS